MSKNIKVTGVGNRTYSIKNQTKLKLYLENVNKRSDKKDNGTRSGTLTDKDGLVR